MTCQYDAIVGPRWPLPIETVEALWAKLQEPAWFGESPYRSGFVDLERYDDFVIMGHFAIEKPLHIVQYDEEKHREERDEESFEHLWFGLFLHAGRSLAQRRQFRHRGLSGEEALNRLHGTLLLTFAALDVPALSFRPYERVIEKETFLAEFAQGGVREVRIESLGGTEVPPETVLFNPEVDKDKVLRSVLSQDNEHVNAVTAEATEDGDLEKAKIVRGEIAAGDPRYLRRQDETGRTIILHREIKERLQFPVDLDEARSTPSEADKERIVAEVEERPIPRRHPRRPPDQVQLFQDPHDEH